MKNRIGSLSYPVISFLSPSPSASRRAQSILSKLCGLEKVKLTSATLDDNLNSAFKSVVPRFSQTWDSVGRPNTPKTADGDVHLSVCMF